jgi:hypothetical protein
MSFQPPPSPEQRNRARSRFLLVLLIVAAGLGLAWYSWMSTGSDPSFSGGVSSNWSSSDYEKDKARAFNRLNSLIRRYNRREAEWLRSEDRYLEDLHLYFMSYSQLVMQQTPGLFAGELPAHDERGFDDYVEAAEAVLEELDIYVDAYEADQDENYPQLESVREEVALAVEATFPGSGNKMNDALISLQLPEYVQVKQRTDDNLKAIFAGGMIDSVTSGASMLQSLIELFKK